MRIITLDTVDSTNSEAKRRLDTGCELPLWIMSYEQSAGRGRRGRDWVSQRGNLFCSGVYPLSGSAVSDAQKSFVAALATYDMLAEYVDSEKLSLKWPNDVLIEGQKVSGLLLERHERGLIVGIGVNLVNKPEITQYPVTCVLDHMAEGALNDPEPLMTGPEAALAVLARQYNHWNDIHNQQGFVPIRAAWLDRAYGMGQVVKVRLANESFEGYAKGLTEQGGLIVQHDTGEPRIIVAGDVFFV